MHPQRWLSLAALILLSSLCHGDVPLGWQWSMAFPFRGITVSASSEQADQWPAVNVVDGITDEPEGLWQTLREDPKSAWLELQLEQPHRIVGVNVFHQLEPRYYRSLDYSISCLTEAGWKTVAEVTDNKTAGWREHPCDTIEVTKVRLDITKSAYGYRMGLNEVKLVWEPEIHDDPLVRTLGPYHCGPVQDMGVITFDTVVPDGSQIEFSTRTAPDRDGVPGQWSEWSAPYAQNGAKVTSPLGEWIELRATFRGAERHTSTIRRVTVGSPPCVQNLVAEKIIPEPGEPLELAVRFRGAMDTRSAVSCLVELPGSEPFVVQEGAWDDAGRTWRPAPLTAVPRGGTAMVHLAGAKRPDGLMMIDEQHTLPIGTAPILERLQSIAEWIMHNEQSAIFIEGYHERTLLALYEITGDERYLAHVRKWATKLLDAQKPAGYWGTGYGDVYFADTGSALGLLINLYKFATPDEKARIDTALERYFHLLLVKGDSTGKPFVHEEGSVGVGYHADMEGNIKSDLNSPYTIATALTGAEIFAAWYYMKGNERDKDIAMKACDWVLDTMVGDEPSDPWSMTGQIPYYIEDWNKDGKDRQWVWKRWPYDTSAYAGEGFIAAWTYINDEAFRERLGRRVKPHIEWLLRTQNGDGSWAARGSGDQLRSHGVVNLLLWYHEEVDRDPRVADAIRRYCSLLLDEEASAYLAVPGNGIATSLAGRALVEIIRPGVDCYRWKDE